MLFSAKVGQEIRPMNELSDRCIEDLPTHGKVGWGGGGGGLAGEKRIFFRRDVIAVMVKEEGTNAGMHAPLYEHSLWAIEMIGS